MESHLNIYLVKQMLMMKKMIQSVGDELSECILSHVSHSHTSIVMKLMRNEKSLLSTW